MYRNKFSGVWMTDIDDTLIESGELPDDKWINWLTEKIRILKERNIVWVPMSGVALVKLGPRILYRLPEDVLSHVLYYGGDGSQKYYFDFDKNQWTEDEEFKKVFSDAQAIAILGCMEYRKELEAIYSGKEGGAPFIEEKISYGREVLIDNNMSPDNGILGEMRMFLKEKGYDPDNSETYFRGGSVSWMMLGDIQAEPYKEKNAVRVRKELIDFADTKLEEKGRLADLGESAVHIPFPGARGIKFVLEGNNKERATKNIIESSCADSGTIVFAGNEIFSGGNDNMIRNISEITILSFGDKTDPGENIVFAGAGVVANRRCLDAVCLELSNGMEWASVIKKLKTAKY